MCTLIISLGVWVGSKHHLLEKKHSMDHTHRQGLIMLMCTLIISLGVWVGSKHHLLEKNIQSITHIDRGLLC